MTVSSEALASISTPERVDSRLGSLEFIDGVPTGETVETVYDHLDFAHAVNVFLGSSLSAADAKAQVVTALDQLAASYQTAFAPLNCD